jgi:hypothetical protein
MIKQISILLGLLSIGALYLAKEPKPEPMNIEEFQHYDEARAQTRAESAAKLATAVIPPSEIELNLPEEEIAAKIRAIDTEIESRDLVNKANRGALSIEELSQFRQKLDLRSRYFERKIQIELDRDA